MIQAVRVTNPSGETLELNLRSSFENEGLLIFNMTGLGSAKATANGVGGVYYDGVRVNSVSLDARTISMTVAIPKQGLSEEIARAKIYKFFPIKKTILLEIITDIRTVQTYAIVEGSVMNSFAKVENVELSLLCPDPYFIDAVENVLTISNSSATPQFEFPFSNESTASPLISFGEIQSGTYSGYINYSGGIETGVIFEITLTSNIGDLTITNTNGNQEMNISLWWARLYFNNLESGDKILINTKTGEKSATVSRGGDSINILNGVDVESDWITIKPGPNTITISDGLDPGVNAITDIHYNTLREGV